MAKNTTELKSLIISSLSSFPNTNIKDSIVNFFQTLGYSTKLNFELDNPSPIDFLKMINQDDIESQKLFLEEWQSVDYLFQLTEEQIKQVTDISEFNINYINSYLFLTITLKKDYYSRTQLAQITREINQLSAIPIFVTFKHGNSLTLGIIDRRPNQRDKEKDVLQKITLIKDINFIHPHRAHIEILNDFALAKIIKDNKPENFDDLHQAWRKILDTSELNKRFYREITNWYFWAIDNVTFPDGIIDESIRNATSIIRLITRLIFVWFLKEKGLISHDLFNQEKINHLLKSFTDDESTYYKAILQNLFFATLNTEMNNENLHRKFRNKAKTKGDRDQNYMIHNLYRYEDYFVKSEDFLNLCADIPFLNGGLFECLDTKEEKVIRIDGFSDRKDNILSIPNKLFFGHEITIDLSKNYGDKKRKKEKVQGIINIFNNYKFTIDENTPIEEEIALDPELLGKVFENLLAEYNPETETTARKQTGSFYTPREIVNYMVDESLISYLTTVIQTSSLYKQDAFVTTLPVLQASNLSERDDLNKQDACVTDIFFSEDIDIHQRNLPHWTQKNATYFVTFRLADSIPQTKLRQLSDEREEWLKRHKQPLTNSQKAEYHRFFSQKVDDWLDAGMGECHLKNPQVAEIVATALPYFHGDRYNLGDYVIMPNHVHVLVTPLGNHQLSDILHSWKSYTANKINQLLNIKGNFWQIESYDRIIRSPEHLYKVQEYIANNPQKANIKLPPISISVAQTSNLYKQDAYVTTVEQTSSLSEKLRHLIAYNNQPHQFNDHEVSILIQAIDNLKILDPACGSGAFPMGILQKLVHILAKLDPNNEQWRKQQKEKAIQPLLEDIKLAEKISYEEAREKAIQELEERLTQIDEYFNNNEMDYPRKLFLIENSIYGVDIQPIAIQIAKLRFFISLIVDQKVNDNLPNRGILPLPNLETKFVAANTLIGIDNQLSLRSNEVIEKEAQLKLIRHKYFTARTPKTKHKYRTLDHQLRAKISQLLQSTGLANATADTLARWNPYDQNSSSDFFDS